MSAYGLTREQSVENIVRTAIEYGITDKRQIAYMLGTAQHESDNFATSREYDGPNQAIKNGYSGGDNYFGRGYVQTTHDHRYAEMDRTLGLGGRLIANPDLAATDPKLGAQLMVVGMSRGIYTGVGLDRHIHGDRADYTAAREIVNGTDEASRIAGYSRTWEQSVQGIMDRVSQQGITPRVMPGSPLNDGKLQDGERGPEVARLQDALVRNGASMTADGIYGPGTARAVEAYQRSHNLTADGIAGPETLRALGVTPQQGQGTPQQPAPQPQPAPQTPAPQSPVSQTPAPQTPAPTPTAPTPTPVRPAVDTSWPAPGNFTVNRADKAGEGEGEFGTPRGSENNPRIHKGIDINGREGDPIEPMRAGKVTFTGDGGVGAGNMIIIDHGGGLETRYLHLKGINVQEGQQVTENTQIATMGRTGNTPGDTHLHFETRENGVAVDPRKYLNFPPREVLQQGDEGKDVTRLQEALIKSGAAIKADGDFGAGTKTAVEAFQRSNNLTPDGIAGPATQKALGVSQEQTQTPQTPQTSPQTPTPTPPTQTGAMSDGMLKQGEKGEDVTRLQEALNKNGAKLEADGNFGPATKAAVETYQRSHNLDSDGVAGAKTLTALGLQQQAQTAPSADKPQASTTPTDSAQAPANAQPTPTDKPQTPPTATPAGNDHGHSHAHPQTAPTPQTAATNAPPTATDKPQTPPTGNDHAQPPTQTDKPLISNANHPDNKLYQQAVSNLEQLGPSGGFKSREDLEKAAAAVAVDAKATGLQNIDHISKTNAPNGQSYLVAVQGDPTNPAAKNSYVDYNQATSQTVAQSTSMAEGKSPAAQVAAQPTQQTEQPQQEPIRIAAAAR